jgi:hypothetical protein
MVTVGGHPVAIEAEGIIFATNAKNGNNANSWERLKMKNLRRIEWGLLIVLSLLLQGAQMQPIEPEQRLLAALHTLNVQPEVFMLHHGGRLRQAIQAQQLEDWVQRLSHGLGTGNVHKTVGRDGVKYTAVDQRYGNTVIKFIVIHDRLGDKYVTPYVSLQLMGRGVPTQSFQALKRRCTRLLQSYGIIADYHFSIRGRTLHVTTGLAQYAQKVLTLLGAREVEGMRTDRTVSLSARSPVLPEGIETGRGSMNLQVAARMDSERPAVVLTIGTPIITIEY